VTGARFTARAIRPWAAGLALLALLVAPGVSTAARTAKPAAQPAAPAAAQPAAPAYAAVVAPSALAHRVIALYFHTTYRCASCRAIEANSREAIETAFAEELKSGRLVLRTVNIEDKGNEHFARDYKLFTKSLVLIDEVNGRQLQWKNLEKVWQLLQDKPAFLRYVQMETRAYLTPRS
jgi:hypothetical protein